MTSRDHAGAGAEEEGLVIERVFDAPRELVWRAWTEPEHLMRWYGPRGFTLPTCEIDIGVGGRHLWGMRSPDGQAMFTTGVYREIVPLERFVATDSMADEDGNAVPGMPETILTVMLEDLGGGKTKMTVRQTGWPDANMAAGASGGWSQAFDKLAEALATA